MSDSYEQYTCDQETGEVLDTDDRQRFFTEEFRINDNKSADWVLKKILECETQLLELETRKKIIMDNLDNQLKAQESRRQYLMERFSGELEMFAERELKGCKKQSMQLDYGKIGFRSSPGSTKVKDKKGAVEWLEKQMLLSAITISKSVSVSGIPEAIELPEELFERIGAHRKFYIDSGVK